MTFVQMAEALSALTELSIKYRRHEDRIGGAEPWYVSQKIEVKDGPCLVGTYGNGYAPEEAIEDHWNLLTIGLKDGQYLVVDAGSDRRKAVRWNGFMWEHVLETPHADGSTSWKCPGAAA